MMSSAAAGEGVRNNGDGGRFPFTASQWQELEHQALVYKYIISGIPIPPDLLFTIKTSLDSSILRHHPPHPSIAVGWNWGFGRKIDPEPGRCRRTDGKKWRCSKEAYPDSKYCERHMHRGRNRSRKPVEVNIKTTPSIPSTKSPNYPSPNSHPLSSSDFLYNNNNNNNPTHLISSFNVLSPQDHFLLDSNPYSRRKSYGMNEEHPFFSESSAGTIKTSMSDSWQLSMNNSYPYQQQDHGYYDQLALKIDRKDDDEPQKVMHHFFDEWPPNKDSSTTQLSISIPNAAHDFFLQSHNNHNDN